MGRKKGGVPSLQIPPMPAHQPVEGKFAMKLIGHGRAFYPEKLKKNIFDRRIFSCSALVYICRLPSHFFCICIFTSGYATCPKRQSQGKTREWLEDIRPVIQRGPGRIPYTYTQAPAGRAFILIPLFAVTRPSINSFQCNVYGSS